MGFIPGLFGEVLPVEPLCGTVPGAGTQGPLPGTGVGGGVIGCVLPGAGLVWGVLGAVCVCGVAWVSSPAALVVIGVGGPMVFVGGVIVGFEDAGAGAAVVGAVCCAGAVAGGAGAAVGGGAGGVAVLR